MKPDDPADGYFGESVAARYDEMAAHLYARDVLDPAVDFLAGLAAERRVLELGIGTGRVALPLVARGIEVHGIERSKAMIARLRAKPGSEKIGVTNGDFAMAKADGTFGLAYLVRNTIMNLTSQEAQLACFRNVAEQLEPGGHFVIEVMVPELQRLPRGERFVVFAWDDQHQGIDEYDLVNQGLVSHHFRVVDGRRELWSAPFRYVWPAELDLMAKLAGMSLRERWAAWKPEPFTAESREHISVWQKR